MVYALVLTGVLIVSSLYAKDDDQQRALPLLAGKQQVASRMPLLIGVIESDDQGKLAAVASLLRDNLERSHQFLVTIQSFAELRTTAEVANLFSAGFPLIVFLNEADKGTALEWRMYDATQVLMVKGKKYHKRTNDPAWWANGIADELWPELLGIKGLFKTQIAYSKHGVDKSSYICSVDFSGRKELLIVPSLLEQKSGIAKRVRIAPCWHPDTTYPRLIFSEFTPSNVRLMMTDLHHRTRVVLDADGTHVGVCYAPMGKEVAFVRSGDVWRHFFDPVTHKSCYKMVVKHQGACASPNLLTNGDIIYCCRGKIYQYHGEHERQEIIIDKGYCVGPTVHEERGLLGYSKKIGDTMQLFIYDMHQKSHRQLTTDSGDKIDPCWSPCGNWLAFCYESGALSRIAIINILTGVRYFLTPEDTFCSYPAWSPPLDLADIIGC